ncbi:hypothetical protein [Chelativorans sp. M5D2P16]|uniref:hypothetical protein n=1 Tax=Chelativorans sp. M5D2P16 TaxID=3095678 RepID=UPI002ACB04CD|nr:hypothetical protein [Chelativorans sp. M5D2P16]MDZ5696985.1 hypothetical protein [Chelativorans sp. M5D2P16]
MSSASRLLALLPFAAALAVTAQEPAAASERDQRFFKQVEGQWSGPGEIVAGKYKGTKFVCTFAGSTPRNAIGMALDGGCRVGVFNQDMSAQVERARSGYRGTFLDGAKGKGLDVVSGSVNGKYAVFGIHRNELTGAMRAQLTDEETMNITISVHVEEELVPVIGMTLKRLDTQAVGALATE